MPIMQDANGNPVVVTLDQLLRRIFDINTDAIRTEMTNLPPLTPPTLTKIIDIPFSAFSASSTYVARYPSVTSRNAQARYFVMINKLNVASNGNCYLVGYESAWPKPTYAYSGSINFGGLGTNNVSPYYGSVMGTQSSTGTNPFGPTDSIEIQFPIGVSGPTSGNVEVWMLELK